ncbi:MAG TPA: hypothetical protein VFQ92_17360 [Blastocatellia bacterium]|nr:hypothetical protein [Blastocatellia bacterium]
MKRLVRHLIELTFFTVFVAVMAATASAQSSDTGTVTITGTVNSTASLRWWTFTNNNAVSGLNAPNTQNSPLVFTLDLGDVSPNNASNYVGGTVQVIMRTNAPYTLSAAVTASSGFGAVGNTNGDLALTDIGFGIPQASLAASGTGALVTATAVSGSTVVAAFDNNPLTAAKDGDGIPTFGATLNNLSTTAPGTQVLSGPRISRGGGLNSQNNGLLANTIYAVGPQFFTPTGSFSATVTYTLATP